MDKSAGALFGACVKVKSIMQGLDLVFYGAGLAPSLSYYNKEHREGGKKGIIMILKIFLNEAPLQAYLSRKIKILMDPLLKFGSILKVF